MGWTEIGSHQVRENVFFKIKLPSKQGWSKPVRLDTPGIKSEYWERRKRHLVFVFLQRTYREILWARITAKRVKCQLFFPAGSGHICSRNRRIFHLIFRLEDCENHIKTLQFVSTRPGRCLFDNLSPELNVKQTWEEGLWDVYLRERDCVSFQGIILQFAKRNTVKARKLLLYSVICQNSRWLPLEYK